jgi:mono/diheme cytochrome c family protein
MRFWVTRNLNNAAKCGGINAQRCLLAPAQQRPTPQAFIDDGYCVAIKLRNLVGMGLLLATLTGQAAQDDLLKRGEYVFRASGCAGCHTDTDNDGPLLAGGRALQTPFGTFYSPNITPDSKYGIGSWNDADFIRALALGIAPDGSYYYPAFPYTSYTRMRRNDIIALKAYLFTLPPVEKKNKPHNLPWYLNKRYLNWVWNLFNFTPGEFQTRPERSSQWNRGAYLSLAMAHCAECHSPRDFMGGLNEEQLYAGTKGGPEGEVVPNITPHKNTGIGRWSEDDLIYFLETGATPGGDYTASLMAEVIDEGLRYLTKEDLQAIARYIHTLPPIEHAVKLKKRKKRGEFD